MSIFIYVIYNMHAQCIKHYKCTHSRMYTVIETEQALYTILGGKFELADKNYLAVGRFRC